jgi:hypothetical protein
MDTVYDIFQYQIQNNLFVGLNYWGDIGCSFISVMDIKNNKWLVNHKLQSDEYSLSDYLGSSGDNKYHLFEGGSAASEREFEILDSNNKIMKSGGYYPGADKNELKWIKGNMIFYFYECAKNTSPPKNLPKLEDGFFYAQKHYWVNGKDSMSNEYKAVYVE